ncbi:LacI family DNA-binding transcriptional regulator [Brachybacterium sp. UNK5269]|uniref:LacI family DNA-binding transcriptional regulator n=1 Tax=Brachybacterium sp. UNK5269 TaxID=3408576 RepID=UPI003BAFD245
MTDRRVTLKDVAAASGVSPATVSFVLNRTAGQTISAATRQRVEAVADRLGYAPHGLARALREGSSRVVVLRVDRTDGGSSLHGFVRGMREELASLDHALVVHAVEGAPAGPDEDLDRALAGLRPHAVLDLVGAYAQEEAADGGWVDGLAAHSRTQLEHLVDRGHRHLALALPERVQPDRVRTARHRYALAAAERLGLPAPREIVVPADARRAAGVLSALQSAAPQVSAVAGFDDETALRVLAALSDLGLSAPADLAVIGFDEGRHAALWRPALTTVRIEAETFGRRAARSALGLELGDWSVAPSAVVRRETA